MDLDSVSVVVHIYNHHTWESEAGRLRVEGQAGVYSEILSQKIRGGGKRERERERERDKEEEGGGGGGRKEVRERGEEGRKERRTEGIYSISNSVAPAMLPCYHIE
jgi:hypothetical protein